MMWGLFVLGFVFGISASLMIYHFIELSDIKSTYSDAPWFMVFHKAIGYRRKRLMQMILVDKLDDHLHKKRLLGTIERSVQNSDDKAYIDFYYTKSGKRDWDVRSKATVHKEGVKGIGLYGDIIKYMEGSKDLDYWRDFIDNN
jgi:hypothetical protein